MPVRFKDSHAYILRFPAAAKVYSVRLQSHVDSCILKPHCKSTLGNLGWGNFDVHGVSERSKCIQFS